MALTLPQTSAVFARGAFESVRAAQRAENSTSRWMHLGFACVQFVACAAARVVEEETLVTSPGTSSDSRPAPLAEGGGVPGMAEVEALLAKVPPLPREQPVKRPWWRLNGRR